MALSSTVKILQEIANYIKEENVKSKERIPTSETFIKKMSSIYGKSDQEIKTYLEQLAETHFIFIINTVAPDTTLFVQGVDSYIYAEQSILNELRHYVEGKLISAYEGVFYKRKTSFQIRKELFSKIKEYNNTALGRSLKESIVLEEFNKTISSNAFEYTDSWRKEKLYKLYKEEEDLILGTNKDLGEDILSSGQSNNKKDSHNSKWQKAVNQFSIPFLLRIHIKKFEFDIIKKLIMTGKIGNLSDFIFIRNMLKEMEKNKDDSTIVKYKMQEIIDLRRIAQAKINIIRKTDK